MLSYDSYIFFHSFPLSLPFDFYSKVYYYFLFFSLGRCGYGLYGCLYLSGQSGGELFGIISGDATE